MRQPRTQQARYAPAYRPIALVCSAPRQGEAWSALRSRVPAQICRARREAKLLADAECGEATCKSCTAQEGNLSATHHGTGWKRTRTRSLQIAKSRMLGKSTQTHLRLASRMRNSQGEPALKRLPGSRAALGRKGRQHVLMDECTSDSCRRSRHFHEKSNNSRLIVAKTMQPDSRIHTWQLPQWIRPASLTAACHPRQRG